MVMTLASSAMANEASRDRGNGESIISQAFKFAILVIAILALGALIVGLYLFNSWLGFILDIPSIVFNWATSSLGDIGGAIGGAIGSLFFGFGDREFSKISGVQPV